MLFYVLPSVIVTLVLQTALEMSEGLDKWNTMSKLASDFVQAAKQYGKAQNLRISMTLIHSSCLSTSSPNFQRKSCSFLPQIIISEQFLPEEKMTIRPAALGGIAGMKKLFFAFRRSRRRL
jgi:hypothetical protein